MCVSVNLRARQACADYFNYIFMISSSPPRPSPHHQVFPPVVKKSYLDAAMPTPLVIATPDDCSAGSSLSSDGLSYSEIRLEGVRDPCACFDVVGVIPAVSSKSDGEDSLKGTIVSRDRSMSEGSMSTITDDGKQLEEDMGMLWGEEEE